MRGLRRRSGVGMSTLMLLFAGLMALPISAAQASPQDPTGNEGENPRIMLVLDASGSMNGPDPSGVTKLEAAKTALTTALDSIPADAEVGLRVYGATVADQTPTTQACADTQLAHPISALDVPGLTAAINSFTAVGHTPISYALQEAAADLGADGKRHIILVSDGEETCVADPCAAVQDIMASGINLQIDTVGFAVNDTARQQLACIAAAGNGSYYDAADADGLTSALATLSTRTARPFTVEGTPVVGTTDTANAPTLTAGQYIDELTYSTGGDSTSHYTIRRTIAGSSIRANVLGRLPAVHGSDGYFTGAWEITLSTPDGTSCGSDRQATSDAVGLGVLVSGTVMAPALDPLVTSPAERARVCAEAEELTLSVTPLEGSTGGSVPVEIRVVEEAEPANLTDLPAGSVNLDTAATLSQPATGTPTSVVGGSSFNDATTLSPGFYETTLIPGEMVFFSTPVGWGQSLAFVIDGVDTGHPVYAPLNTSAFFAVHGSLYGPDGTPHPSTEHVSYVKAAGELVPRPMDPLRIAQVSFRNRWDSPDGSQGTSPLFSMAGDYYMGLAYQDSEAGLRGVPVPVRFQVSVEGEVTGVPEFTATSQATPAASPSPSEPAGTSDRQAEPSGGLSPAVVAGGVLAGSGVVGALTYAAIRRKRSQTR